MHAILDLWVPVVLVLLMFIVGLGLRVDDFRRLRDRIGTVCVATVGQILIVPLVAGLLVLLFEPPAFIAIGLVLLSACPGGALSNYYAHLANADLALSVTLTAISSLASIVFTPLAAYVGCSLFIGENIWVDIPLQRILLQLMFFIVLPIGLGMILRYRRPRESVRWLPKLNLLGFVALAALLVAVFVDQRSALDSGVLSISFLAIAFTFLCFGLGWGLGWALSLDSAGSLTLALEFSVRNLGVMALIAVTILGQLEYLLFGAIFLVVQMPTALTAVFVLKRFGTKKAGVAAANGPGAPGRRGSSWFL
ncbi:MAG: hypothetical protein P8Y44_07695 [Acidobacteriota bacterium]